MYHHKVLIIAVPQDGAPRNADYKLDEDQRAAQQAHLERLASVGRYREIRFANADRLAVDVLRSKLQDILASEEAGSNVFISYSHRDAEFLARLMVHLRPLERQGLIDLWVDTKLEVGDQWRSAIEEALTNARVAILLISADFLASDFIVQDELAPLLDQAKSKGLRIIPVIIKPCRFQRDKSLSRFQAINDPTAPLSTLLEGEQERIYDRISEAVEKAMAK